MKSFSQQVKDAWTHPLTDSPDMAAKDDKINKVVIDKPTSKEQKKYDLCMKQCHYDWQQDIRDEASTPLDYYFEKSAAKFCRIAHLRDDDFMGDDEEKQSAMHRQYKKIVGFHKERGLAFWGEKEAIIVSDENMDFYRD